MIKKSFLLFVMSVLSIQLNYSQEQKFTEYKYVYTIHVPNASNNEKSIAIDFGISALKSVAEKALSVAIGGGSKIIGVVGFVSGLPSVGNSPESDITIFANGQTVDQIKMYQPFVPIVYFSSGDYSNYNPVKIFIQKKKGFSWNTVDEIRLFNDKHELYLHDLIIPKRTISINDPGDYRLKIDTGRSYKFTVLIGTM